MQVHPSYESTFYRVSIKVLVINNENKFLVMIDSKDRLALPGGGVEHSESLKVAASRELKEEVGLNIPASDIGIAGALSSIDEGHDPKYPTPIPRLNVISFTSYNNEEVNAVGDDKEEIKACEWVSIDGSVSRQWRSSIVGGHKNNDEIATILKDALKRHNDKE